MDWSGFWICLNEKLYVVVHIGSYCTKFTEHNLIIQMKIKLSTGDIEKYLYINNHERFIIIV